MFNNKTIRFRVSIMSLLIMTLSVLTILLGYYVLQQQGQKDILMQPEDIQMIHQGSDENVQPLITMVQARYQQKQTTLFIQMMILSGGVLILGSLLIYWVIKKELHTLEELKNRLQGIDFQKETNIIDLPTKNEEMKALIDAFNAMMEKLQHAYHLQKRFAQNAAHELKTPVTVMMTNIQVEKMTNKEAERIPLLNVLEKQVVRLSSLIEGLLRLNNQADLLKKDVQVHAMIEDILKTQLSTIHDKQLTIQIDGELTLHTDEDYLYGVLKNIIENAVVYNVQNGHIHISLSHTSITIEDTGIGMPQNALQDVFSPFYCCDESRTKTTSGYGLGLSIVDAYLKKLHYQYWVESEENKGTIFKLECQ